jgi:hypothetical protein
MLIQMHKIILTQSLLSTIKSDLPLLIIENDAKIDETTG